MRSRFIENIEDPRGTTASEAAAWPPLHEVGAPSVYGHPAMTLLVDAHVDSYRSLLMTIATASEEAERMVSGGVSLSSGAALIGASMMTAMGCPASEVDVQLRGHVHVDTGAAESFDDARYRAAEALAVYATTLIDALGSEGCLRLCVAVLWRRSRADKALSGHGAAAEHSRWTRADLDAATLAGFGPSLVSAIRESCGMSCAFMTVLDGVVREVELQIGWTLAASSGESEIGVGPEALWFGRVCFDRRSADHFRRGEHDLLRAATDCGAPRPTFLRLNAERIEAAWNRGAYMNALKRMAESYAYGRDVESLSMIRGALSSSWSRARSLGKRIRFAVACARSGMLDEESLLCFVNTTLSAMLDGFESDGDRHAVSEDARACAELQAALRAVQRGALVGALGDKLDGLAARLLSRANARAWSLLSSSRGLA